MRALVDYREKDKDDEHDDKYDDDDYRRGHNNTKLIVTISIKKYIY